MLRRLFSTAPFLRPEEYVQSINFTTTDDIKMPLFQVIDVEGNVIPGAEQYADIEKGTLNKMMKTMLTSEIFDEVFVEEQTLGQISFYLTNWGEEALHAGSVAALDPDDMIFCQYREVGGFFYRGFSIDEAVHGCYCNELDNHKGRMMPIHYGTSDLNIHSISSPLGTQISHAAGVGYSFRFRKQPLVSTVYLGDGSASEGDASVALNFAATRLAQTLFICRNNQYAISTPIENQYKGLIASRGVAFGMPSIRVDGNDFLAMYHATKAAREKILTDETPAFLEALTYRLGGHSTNDDPNRYIDKEERSYHAQFKPIDRCAAYMQKHDLIDFDMAEFKAETKKKIQDLRDLGREVSYGKWDSFFDDVYDELPPNIAEQKEELRQHLEEYKDWYKNLGKFKLR